MARNCGGCPGKTKGAYNYRTASNSNAAVIGNPNVNKKGVVKAMSDEEYILSKYDHPNRGQHKVVGGATRNFYGHRAGGEVFYVHMDDIKAQPHIYKPVKEAVQQERVEVEEPTPVAPPKPVQAQAEPQAKAEQPQEPQLIRDTFLLPGITPEIQEQLTELGATTPEAIYALGAEKLMEIKGVGKARAKAILHYAKENMIVEE